MIQRLRHSMLWWPLAVLLVTLAGSAALLTPRCVALSERDRHSYGLRPLWQAGFDALSATCGVGLLTYDLEREYTEFGRWVLLSLGVAGAWCYLVAAWQVTARLLNGQQHALPRIGTITAAFFGWQALLAGVVLALGATGVIQGDWQHLVWNTISAFASLGWLRAEPGSRWVFAAVALLGALGWPLWLFWRHGLNLRPHVKPLFAFALLLLLGAVLITALEVPRKATRTPAPTGGERLATCSPRDRFERALVQVAAAAGGGLPTEPLGDRAVGEGTKFVLAGVVLMGGLGGSPGGGIKWPLLLCVLSGSAFAWRRLSKTGAGDFLPVALATVLTVCFLTLVTAFGLLIIESWIGSAYRLPPTLADALLESASAVGGAGLTSGLTANLTAASLSSGIRQPVDLYQYGMGWLMLAMLAGRVVPLLVLARAARGRFVDPDTPLPPL